MDKQRSRDVAKRHSNRSPTEQKSSAGDIARFLNAAKSANNGGDGRVIFALDATMSRQATWDLACKIQGDMFLSVSRATPLNMKLVYFRGYGECRASRWAKSGSEFATMMSRIDCRAGHTQIGKVLKHATDEVAATQINALVYIGDAMEENPDDLGQLAGKLGLRNVPVFMFQEGHDPKAEVVFKEIARITRGGWFRFDANAPEVLKSLLSSIAVYATGGLKALEARGSNSDQILLEKLGKGRR